MPDPTTGYCPGCGHYPHAETLCDICGECWGVPRERPDLPPGPVPAPPEDPDGDEVTR